MSLDLDKWISIFTFAGLVGLVILHPGGAASVIGALAKASTDYVKAVQGQA